MTTPRSTATARLQDDLAAHVARRHARHGRRCLVEVHDGIELGPQVAFDAESHQPPELLARAHRRADDVQVQPEEAGELDFGDVAARRARVDQRAAAPQRPDRVLEGRRADRVHHRIDALGQPRAGLERGSGAERFRERALLLVAARHPDAQPGGHAEPDQRVGEPARSALDQDGRARGQLGLGEQHPVGGEPRGRQARRLLEAQLRRLVDQVAGGHRHALGQGALRPLGQQRQLRVELFGTVPRGIVDHAVDDDLAPVRIDAGSVAAEDHRQLLLREADAAGRPDVVVVQRRRADLDHEPAVGRFRLGAVAHLDDGGRVIGVERADVGGAHAGKLPRDRTVGGRWRAGSPCPILGREGK